jgi:hypothetical protein
MTTMLIPKLTFPLALQSSTHYLWGISPMPEQDEDATLPT